MADFLEGQVLPELGRKEAQVKKRDNWAQILALNEIREQRIQEESNIVMTKLEQELSDATSMVNQVREFPEKTANNIIQQIAVPINTELA